MRTARLSELVRIWSCSLNIDCYIAYILSADIKYQTFIIIKNINLLVINYNFIMHMSVIHEVI